ncbi:MAG: TadE/TadG family type IV pilus assembly protein, partial [Acidimicrobiia bacterium]
MTPRREKGASLVEVGLVLPILILLAIGLSEIGFLIVDYLTVTNAAREGA